MKTFIVRIIHEFEVKADDENAAIDQALKTPYSNAQNCDIECNEIKE